MIKSGRCTFITQYPERLDRSHPCQYVLGGNVLPEGQAGDCSFTDLKAPVSAVAAAFTLSGSIRVRVTGQGGSFPLERSAAPAPAPLRRSLASLHRLLSLRPLLPLLQFPPSSLPPSAFPLHCPSPCLLTALSHLTRQDHNHKTGFHFTAHLVFLSTLRCLSGISHLSLFIPFPTNKELLFPQNNRVTGHRGQEDHARSVSGTGTERKNPGLHSSSSTMAASPSSLPRPALQYPALPVAGSYARRGLLLSLNPKGHPVILL